jgi:hypothetical protein
MPGKSVSQQVKCIQQLSTFKIENQNDVDQLKAIDRSLTAAWYGSKSILINDFLQVLLSTEFLLRKQGQRLY